MDYFELRFAHVKRKSLYAFAILTSFIVLQLFASLYPLAVVQRGMLTTGPCDLVLEASSLSGSTTIPQLSRSDLMNRLIASAKPVAYPYMLTPASFLLPAIFEFYDFCVSCCSDVSGSVELQYPTVSLKL